MSTQENLTRAPNQDETLTDLERVTSRLEAAGYLQPGEHDAEMFGPALSDALQRYQTHHRLPSTGILDTATLHKLNTTVRYDSLPAAPLGIDDQASFVPSGTKWLNRRLRYKFVNNTSDLSIEQARAAIRCALKQWSEVAPVWFVEVPSNAAAELQFGFFSGDHGDGPNNAFDGPYPTGPILGHAPPPPASGSGTSKVHFDEAETWTVNVQQLIGQPFDLVQVALHEVGHALGLMHSADPSAVMFDQGSVTRSGLALDDIRGIRQVYASFGHGATNPVPMPQASGQTFIFGDHRRLDLAQQGVGMDVFYRGGDSHLRQAHFKGFVNGNESWESVDHGIAIQGTPILFTRGNREQKDKSQFRINVFAVDVNGHLRARTWDGFGWSSADFGGNLHPELIMFGRGNFGSVEDQAVRLVICAINKEGHLVDAYWNGNQWSTNDHGAFFNPGLAVMGYGEHHQVDAARVRTHIFLTQMGSNQLIGHFWNGAEWLGIEHGGSVTGTPAILLRGDLTQVDTTKIRAQIFIAGTDGQLWEREWDGMKWNWVAHSDRVVSGNPIVISHGNLDSVDKAATWINVFIRGADGQLLVRTWDGSQWFWADLGGNITNTPLQWVGHGNFCSIENTQVRLRIFAHGVDNHLYEYHWNTIGWDFIDHGVGLSGTGVTSQLLSPMLQGASASPDDLATKIRLFVPGANGKLFYRRWAGGGPSWMPEI